MTDPDWCYENPAEAAAEIDRLEARIDEAEKIINGWIMSLQTTQATWDAIRQLGKWYVEAS